jgi:ferredoxin
MAVGARIFDSRPVELHPESCLNARFRPLQCERCVTACPVGAIIVENAAPSVDPSRCTRCGICLHSCPTGVFSQRHVPESTLLFVAAQVEDAPLAVACPLHPAPSRTPAACAAVLVHGRCLAALAPDHLLALSAGGRRTVWLDDSPCMACVLGQSTVSLATSVAAANILLTAFGAAAAIRMVSRAGIPAQRPLPAAVIDSRQPQLSRRGFFGMVRRVAAEYASAPEPAASASLPPARTRLLTQLQTLPQTLPVTSTEAAGTAVVDTQLIPFANVAIDPDACTGCGLCSRFCPTGALAFTAGDGAFQIDFAPAACVDCGICALACPPKALDYTPTAPAAALVDGTRRILVRASVLPDPVSPGHARERASLFEQLAGAQRRPAHNHQNGGVARPSCQTEGVRA